MHLYFEAQSFRYNSVLPHNNSSFIENTIKNPQAHHPQLRGHILHPLYLYQIALLPVKENLWLNCELVLRGILLKSLKNQPTACMTMTRCVIIMANRLTGETHYISLKEKDKSHAHTKRLYFNRTFGGDCHYCIIDGDIDASTSAS